MMVNERRRRGGRKKSIPARAAALLLPAAFCAAFFCDPERYAAKCFEGIALWAQCVLPALFPFMTACALLCGGLAGVTPAPIKKLCSALKLPPCAATCFALGAASGYPAGSRTVRQFFDDGLTDVAGARKLALLCTACGPVFAVATAGSMLGGAGAGVKLYAAHLAAVTLTALTYSLCTKPCGGGLPLPAVRKNVLEDSFYGTVKAALTAGAFIAFFYTAAAMAEDFYILYPLSRLLSLPLGSDAADALAHGLVEMTGGIAALARCGGKLALPLAGFTLTFGGACVLLQQLSFLSATGVKPAFFISFKFVQGLACFAILLISG